MLVVQHLEEEPYTCARSCGCPGSFHWRNPKGRDIIQWVTSNRVEWLAGITTGLTAVPTAVAFSILAGVKPSVGLRGTWIIMLVMSLFGGETAAITPLRCGCEDDNLFCQLRVEIDVSSLVSE